MKIKKFSKNAFIPPPGYDFKENDFKESLEKRIDEIKNET